MREHLQRHQVLVLKLSELGTQVEGRSNGLINWLLPQSPAQETFHEMPSMRFYLHPRLQRITDLCYAMFHCKECCCIFNERTGTPFNFIQVPTYPETAVGRSAKARVNQTTDTDEPVSGGGFSRCNS
jgi:hypothetical protein